MTNNAEQEMTRTEQADSPWFGCFTGDCPHDKQTECDAAIRAEFARMEREEAERNAPTVAANPAPKRQTPNPGIGMPAALHLDSFGALLWDAFGEPAYHVGSSLMGKAWRDVDVRLMLDDEQYEAMGLGDPKHPHQNPKWVALTLAFAALGREMTGLPIDFQIQQTSHANGLFRDGARSALGCHSKIRTGPLNDGEVGIAVAVLRKQADSPSLWHHAVLLNRVADALPMLAKPPATPASSDVLTDGERWSFARRCVQAGYYLRDKYAEAPSYENASAELDTLATHCAGGNNAR